MSLFSLRAFIGFGSNLGDLHQNYLEVRARLAGQPEILKLSESPLFLTEPLVSDGQTQPWYLNGVFEIETSLGLRDLFNFLKQVERDMGRVSQKKWSSRVVDLDILFYGDVIFKDADICVPHREICYRPFVLRPLHDLAPGFIHPEMMMTMTELLEACSSTLRVEPYDLQLTGTDL